VSVLDDSLVLLFGLHVLTAISGILTLFAILVALVVYGLTGFTPMIPKRVSVPVMLFYIAGFLAVFPFLIYCDDPLGRTVQLDWVASFCQVVVGLGVLYWLRGGLKFRWPLVEDNQLGDWRFSWLNLSVFLLANVFVLLPAIAVYLVLCAALAVNHSTDGFMALRPWGITVQVRKYVRNDGKTIELVPMQHIGDPSFYQKILQSFPTNAIILMEGVTDKDDLITNQFTYKHAARALHLASQEKAFEPRGRRVMADVDVSQFTTNTIEMLNQIALIYSKGLNADTLMKWLQHPPPPHFEHQLFVDLVKKRNRHLMAEIQAWLPKSDNIIVPWGAGHMPGIASGIQKAGFHLETSQTYTVVRFHFAGK
jgi:hypothetical protein